MDLNIPKIHGEIAWVHIKSINRFKEHTGFNSNYFIPQKKIDEHINMVPTSS